MPDFVVKSGDLKVRLIWQARSKGSPPHPGGQAPDIYATRGVYWGKVEAVREIEKYAAAQNHTTIDVRIILRGIGDVRPGDRLVVEAHPTRIYDVQVPTRPGERPGFIVLTAAAVVLP